MTGYQIDTGDHQSALRKKAEGGPQSDSAGPVHPLLTLQSQIGNAQVARLLAQREEAPDDELQKKHDSSVQRDDDQAQADHETVGIEGGPVGPDTAQRISSARGGGSALDSGTRASMEGGFGTSFEDVRVHHDSESDVLNRRLTSHAFTTGSDIFLRSDASPSDSKLMAHELTHVVQQRSMSGGGSMNVGAADDSHETHADSMAANIAAMHDQSVQREDAPQDDNLQKQHDYSVQREDAPQDDELQKQHDYSVQREEAPDEDA